MSVKVKDKISIIFNQSISHEYDGNILSERYIECNAENVSVV